MRNILLPSRKSTNATAHGCCLGQLDTKWSISKTEQEKRNVPDRLDFDGDFYEKVATHERRMFRLTFGYGANWSNYS